MYNKGGVIMKIDALRAGVAPGGLVNTTEIKVLICYILKSVKEPVPATKLCDLLFYKGIANAFEVSDSIESLLKNKNIVCVNEKEQTYTTTESGDHVADTLKTTVPLSIREKACKSTLKMMAEIRNAKETDISIVRNGDNTYITCSALDNGNPIMSVQLLVSDESQAISIKNKFLESPSEIYSKIIDLFTNNN